MKKQFVGFVLFSLLACNSYADTWVPTGTRVLQVATGQLYAQNAVILKLSAGTSDCPAGSYVYYYPLNPEDLKVMYATVFASYLAQTPVLVHFPRSGCTTDNIGVGT